MHRVLPKISQKFIPSTISKITLSLITFIGVMMAAAPAQAQTFTLGTVVNNYTAIYSDGTGRTITVTGSPQDPDCFSYDAAGRIEIRASESFPACNGSTIMTFQTNGFALDNVTFTNIDDFDGTAPRDTMAANVAGTWTSPTIEIFSFSSPPPFADQAGRLQAAGGVGTFIANASGNNPVDEQATFDLATASTTVGFIFDDADGTRGATAFFDLGEIVVTDASGTISATNDNVSGIDGTAGQSAILNVFSGDSLNGIAADSGNATLSIASGSSLPPELTFDPTTGEIGVTPGSAGGSYSFSYTICEIGFPSNCQTATATVNVTVEIDLAISKTNTPGVNGNVDQTDDIVVSGSTTTYSLLVSNNGPGTVNGPVVTDTPGAEITCAASTPVTITGDGVPAGSFTFSDLSGAGITLGTLSNGQSVTLSYSCQVN